MRGDEGDLKAVAEAYRAGRLTRPSAEPAYLLAVAVYRGRHPELDEAVAGGAVDRLIAEAERRYGPWDAPVPDFD